MWFLTLQTVEVRLAERASWKKVEKHFELLLSTLHNCKRDGRKGLDCMKVRVREGREMIYEGKKVLTQNTVGFEKDRRAADAASQAGGLQTSYVYSAWRWKGSGGYYKPSKREGKIFYRAHSLARSPWQKVVHRYLDLFDFVPPLIRRALKFCNDREIEICSGQTKGGEAVKVGRLEFSTQRSS